MAKSIFKFQSAAESAILLGSNDDLLHLLEEELSVSGMARGDELTLEGEDESIKSAQAVLEALRDANNHGVNIGPADVVSAAQMQKNGTLEYFADFYTEVLFKDIKNHAIRVKNYGQRQYIEKIQHNDVIFGVGPAGTGKTYLAVVMALAALKRNDVERIIITRPAVEAGESLGFLPGDLREKVDPYLRPIYDAMYALIGKEAVERYLDRGVIEIAPLAYMRGRTLDNAFIILDEAQNTTNQQMKMFLTRLGFGSKMIVNGDASQIDLPRGKSSGLLQAEHILQNVKRIGFINFSHLDVVRHPVVGSIVNAYEQAEVGDD